VYLQFAAVPGDPLDVALRTYGPADIHDALPRLLQLAQALDVVAAHGLWHGALTPGDILVSAEQTSVLGVGVAGVLQQCGCELPPVAPYAAPEVAAVGAREPASDEFALAVIAYEWLFGRPPSLDSVHGIGVPSLPGVDRRRMREVFARAMSQEPEQRFPSCAAFVEALAATTRPAHVVPAALDDLPIVSAEAVAEPTIVHAAPRFASVISEPAVFSSAASKAEGSSSRARGVMVATVLVGAVAVGAFVSWRFAAGKAGASTAEPSAGGKAFTEAPLAPATPEPASEAPRVPAARRDEAVPTPAVPADRDIARVAQVDAGLLVHSSPEGASVSVDGVEHGMTPVAIRGLALGTRTVLVTRPGYRSAQRQVTLTPDRPSRTLEVGLAQMTAAAPAGAVARDGALVVDSRPAGAAVTLDGRPAGVTPLALASIAPGPHTVRIERPGYRPVSTTVIVTAGQRARVAARLEGGQQEE
jgi:hypothetical protein